MPLYGHWNLHPFGNTIFAQGARFHVRHSFQKFHPNIYCTYVITCTLNQFFSRIVLNSHILTGDSKLRKHGSYSSWILNFSAESSRKVLIKLVAQNSRNMVLNFLQSWVIKFSAESSWTSLIKQLVQNSGNNSFIPVPEAITFQLNPPEQVTDLTFLFKIQETILSFQFLKL